MKKLEKLTEIIEKMSPRKLMLLCGSAALAVFLLLYVILSALFPDQKPGNVAAGNVTVVEAARDIAPQTVLTEEMLKTVEVPANLVPAGALTDKKQALGKKTGIDLFAGDILTERKLTSHGGGFVGMIPDGMRAVSFGVNDVTGVSGFAKPGDKVDILLVTDKEGNGIVSKTLLKDVLILAVNKSSDRPQGTTQTSGSDKKTLTSGSQPAGNSGSTGSMGTPSVVTVALTPYDAAKLIGSSRIGQLQMMLRPADGSAEDKSIGYYVIPLPNSQASAPAPAPAVQRDYTSRPAPQAPAASSGDGGGDADGLSGIEVIRGTSATRGK
ncbi:Flp pilus assembly protein CpaB [Acidaminococcus fermentans]|uniref:Flp pilus assembly protein CpaB n=1 Tax=Acidaminococcus fermentans TaxID=905 RepID=UPI00242B5A13|nr:Flp pilus assembly protein CpaB [Acidaminococcus fermentans]